MSNGKNTKSDQIHTVNTAAGECHPAGTDGGAIAPQPANRPRIVNVTPCDVTPTNSKRNTPNSVCVHCGREYKAKRPKTSRYCGGACRRAAYLLRNPDKARGYAEKSKAQLRAYLEGRGIVWEER